MAPVSRAPQLCPHRIGGAGFAIAAEAKRPRGLERCRSLTSEERLIEGTYADDAALDAKSGVVEPASDFPRTAVEAYAAGVVLRLYEGEGKGTPDTFAAKGAREADYETFVPASVDFKPSVGGACVAPLARTQPMRGSVGALSARCRLQSAVCLHHGSLGLEPGGQRAGLQGVLAKSHPMEPRFRRNFAARLDLELDLPKGTTYLRLKCPSKGGIFMGGRAVYRSEDAAADEVRCVAGKCAMPSR